jgi:CRP/FNR family transcriptional regulator, cyclic AMP receptor protein
MVLAVSDFVSALSDVDRDALLALGTVRRYRSGVTLLHEYDEAGGVLVILEGQVSASVVGRGGTEVILGIAGPGELVGELAALRGGLDRRR